MAGRCVAISQSMAVRALDNQRDEMSAGDQMADNRNAVKSRNIDLEMPVHPRLPAFNVNRRSLQVRPVRRDMNEVIPSTNVENIFKGMESKKQKLQREVQNQSAALLGSANRRRLNL